MHEESVWSSKNLITILYREKPLQKDSLPLNQAKVFLFDDSLSWEQIDHQAGEAMKNKNVISLVHTPTTLNSHICFLFYTEGHIAT